MITFLYILWILYTVGSLSAILLIVTLGWITKVQRTKARKLLLEKLAESRSSSGDYQDSW